MSKYHQHAGLQDSRVNAARHFIEECLEGARDSWFSGYAPYDDLSDECLTAIHSALTRNERRKAMWNDILAVSKSNLKWFVRNMDAEEAVRIYDLMNEG